MDQNNLRELLSSLHILQTGGCIVERGQHVTGSIAPQKQDRLPFLVEETEGGLSDRSPLPTNTSTMTGLSIDRGLVVNW